MVLPRGRPFAGSKPASIFAAPYRNRHMLIIPVKEGESIDKALKKFKKKFEKTGTLRGLRKRQSYTKSSVKRRTELIRARYKMQLITKEQ